MRARLFKSIMASGILAASSVVQAEGDVEAGKYAFTTCSGCHAIPGYTNAYPTYHVPRLGGQKADYLESVLNAYKSGARKHGTMNANAARLMPEEMADIAAYLASFPTENTAAPVHGDAAAGEKKAAEMGCVACHGEGGKAPMPTMPVLAGQFEDYLIHAMKSYFKGDRENAIMAGQMQMLATDGKLNEDDVRNLAAYFASQEPSLAVIEFDGHE